MSILTYPLGFLGGGGEAFYNGVMENSLRFEDGDSPQLARTPAVAGNRKQWTFSTWVKLGNSGNAASETYIISSGTGNSGWTDYLRIASSKLKFTIVDSGALEGAVQSTNLFRDPSAWYHIVMVYDSPNAASGERQRLYQNGQRITDTTDTSTIPQNQDSYFINNANIHRVGTDAAGTGEFDGSRAFNSIKKFAKDNPAASLAAYDLGKGILGKIKKYSKAAVKSLNVEKPTKTGRISAGS